MTKQNQKSEFKRQNILSTGLILGLVAWGAGGAISLGLSATTTPVTTVSPAAKSTTTTTTTTTTSGTTTSGTISGTTSGTSNTSTSDDVTELTISIKKAPPKSVSQVQRFRSDSASSCAFGSATGAEDDAVSDYLQSMRPSGAQMDDSLYPDTGDDQSNSPNSFDTNNPFADAGRMGNQAQNAGSTESGDAGCQQSDINFAAGRAHIARKDKSMAIANDLLDQGKYPEALAAYKKSYDKMGYEEAAMQLSRMYFAGQGTPKDVNQGIFWLKKVAEQKAAPDSVIFDPKTPYKMSLLVEANVMLMQIYLVGDGVPKNLPEALKWVSRADMIGYIPARHNHGDFAYRGIGMKPDLPLARKLYESAATKGFVPAEYAFGKMLQKGEGGPQDLNMALGWFSEAAKSGHGGALYALAEAYDFGEGVPEDQRKALFYYKEAALKGNAHAINAVGTYFYAGKVVAKDDVIARIWFSEAAKGKDVDAMFNLAVMLMKGEGGPQDLVKAWVWFKLALYSGHEDAAKAILACESMMTPEQITQAKAILKGN